MSRRHLGLFLTALLFLTIETMAELLQPTFMASIVDEGVQNADIHLILYYGGIMFIIALLGAVGAITRNIFASRTSQLIGKEMRSDMFRKIQTLSLENIDRLQPASLITRMTNDVRKFKNLLMVVCALWLKLLLPVLAQLCWL